MSAIAIRDEIADYLEAQALADSKPVTVRPSIVPVVELEKETTAIVDVYPVSATRTRNTRDSWQVVQVIRVGLRDKVSARNSPSQIVAAEDAFIALSEWLISKLMAFESTGVYQLGEISESNTPEHDVYVDTRQLVTSADVTVSYIVDI